jgi:hypothetical protein
LEKIYEFGPFRLDELKRELRREGQRVGLTGYRYQILDYLISHRSQSVSKDELIKAVWGEGAYVDDGTLRTHIYNLRKALKDTADEPQYLLSEGKTVKFVFDSVFEHEYPSGTPEADAEAGRIHFLRANSPRDALKRKGKNLNGFAYPQAAWLDVPTAERFLEVAKAALILLAFDRTDSGCWGKTYLFRRKAGDAGMPLARGSLTGTPFSLNAIGAVMDDLTPLRHSLSSVLLETLARTLAEDGRYLRGTRVAQMGVVPDFEALRHTAGAFVAKLLLNVNTTGDLKTLEVLCDTPTDPMAWDKAIVARGLAHAATLRTIPAALRSRAEARVNALLTDLATFPKGASAALRWSNPYGYGLDVTNQWGTAWGILPFISGALPAQGSQIPLRDGLRQFLLAQAAIACDGGTLLPNSMDAAGKGSGQYVFGTAIAILGWRTLELFAEDTEGMEEAAFHGRSMTERLLGNWSGALELPSTTASGDSLALEGYLAWAGLLLAAGSVGIQLGADEAQHALLLAGAMEARLNAASVDGASAAVTSLVMDSGLLAPETIPPVARSVVRVSQLATHSEEHSRNS